ncbi:MAG: mechanosensitive ion channel [bacterium]
MKDITRTLLAAALVMGALWVPPVLAQESGAPATAEIQSAADPVAAVDAAAQARPSVVSEVVRGVSDATHEVGTAVQTGGRAVATQGTSLWSEVLVPMYQRFASALPGVVKALFVLIAFWVIATLLGAGVTRVLHLTDIDNRAAKDWGLDGIAKGGLSIENVAGTAVKWIILLFGFVAFFQSINLPMVASPLQNVVDKVVGVIPNLIKAVFILLAYWIVASLARIGITKSLGALAFDDKVEKYMPARDVRGEKVGPSALLGRLAFYLVLLFGIAPFLEALGQQALVAPLQDMLSKGLGFLPNIVAALILAFIGNMVATIVREIAVNFLAATGLDGAAEKIGLGKVTGTKRLSEIVGTLVYFIIIIPIIVAAVDALGLKAVSDPVRMTLEMILASVPGVLAAAVVVLVGYAIARLVQRVVESFLSGLGADNVPSRIGLDFLTPKKGQATLSSILGNVVMVIILLLTAQQALAVIGFAQLAGLVDEIVRYLPKLFVGVVILFAALSLGAYVGRLTASATAGAAHSRLVSEVARYAVMFLGFSMALDQLGVGREIVLTAVTSVLGGVALALGIAFGLGGKAKAKEWLEKQSS